MFQPFSNLYELDFCKNKNTPSCFFLFHVTTGKLSLQVKFYWMTGTEEKGSVVSVAWLQASGIETHGRNFEQFLKLDLQSKDCQLEHDGMNLLFLLYKDQLTSMLNAWVGGTEGRIRVLLICTLLFYMWFTSKRKSRRCNKIRNLLQTNTFKIVGTQEHVNTVAQSPAVKIFTFNPADQTAFSQLDHRLCTVNHGCNTVALCLLKPRFQLFSYHVVFVFWTQKWFLHVMRVVLYNREELLSNISANGSTVFSLFINWKMTQLTIIPLAESLMICDDSWWNCNFSLWLTLHALFTTIKSM